MAKHWIAILCWSHYLFAPQIEDIEICKLMPWKSVPISTLSA